EMHERERMERREHEQRERDQHLQAMEHEMRELELHRNRLELRIAEMELENRLSQSVSKADEAALEAIKMASRFMEPEAAAEFLTDTLDHVRSPIVQHQMRLQLAELHFRVEQPDRAAEHLRALIAPVHRGGH
ncbi:hypothetical protein NZK35_31225, partial [Stieleria sp. ICT_E10.1]|uniref:hypothetical protein n=1 Tax=Stieleria sedimenti TaxID=2976331 RepID=UPI0021807CE8